MASQSAATKERLIDDEEVLQAVILADSFNKRFRPLSARKPRVRNEICISRWCADRLQNSAYYLSAMRPFWTGHWSHLH